MDEQTFKNARILVVGGAGFVGSNLVLKLLEEEPSEVLVVDNLLSSEACNVPEAPNVRHVCGSITDDAVLRSLPDDLDFAFHLACYHGNQSSIADPLADHENNTLTTLKLFERLKELKNLRKVVYARPVASGGEDLRRCRSYHRGCSRLPFHDSPYSISKLIGEMYGNYYRAHGLPLSRPASRTQVPEILGGRWRGTPHTVWRNAIPTFVWKTLSRKRFPWRTRDAPVATSSTSRTWPAG